MQFKSIKTPLIIMLCAITLVPLMVLWGVVTAQSAKMVGTATDESMPSPTPTSTTYSEA